MKMTQNLYRTLVAILGGVLIMTGCSMDDDGLEESTPAVSSTIPANAATDVPVNASLTATFSEMMDGATVTATVFTLSSGTTPVPGAVTCTGMVATFNPDADLLANTVYTATIAAVVTDEDNTMMSADKVWRFITVSDGIGPAPVFLGSADAYAILAKTAISTIPSSVITGNIGISPAAESYMTGFSQTKATGYSTSPQVTGYMHAADMTPPTPTVMTSAVSDMETAYTDAAGRTGPDYLNLHAGAVGGKTLAPGLYKWNSSVSVLSDATISGGANDIWIFQVSGDLSVADSFSILLAGGAQAKNIYWQVSGTATIGTTAHFEGIILCKTAITLNTGATMNGRLFAQTAVALDTASIGQPAP